MRKRNIAILLLAVLMAFALAACEGGQQDASGSAQPAVATPFAAPIEAPSEQQEEPLLPSQPVHGANEHFEYVIIDNEVTIIKYIGEDATEVAIPAEIDGCAVVVIGDRAFLEESELTAISIPDSVTKIEERAFAGCNSLQSVVLPNGVTQIEECVFYYCKQLTDVSIGSNVTHIGKGAFANCYALSSITLPESVTYVGELAFAWCRELKFVYFEGSVLDVAADAFTDNSYYFTIFHTPGAEGFDKPWNVYPTLVHEDPSTMPFLDTPEPISGRLDQLVNDKTVTATITGDRIESTNVTVQNETDAYVTVEIGPGTWFRSNSSSVQNMLVVTLETMQLAPYESKSIDIKTACMNMRRAIPDSSNSFSVRYDSSTRLAALAEYVAENYTDYLVIQCAVWIISDKASDDALLNSLTRGYNKVIQQKQVDAARALISDLGI